MNTLNSVVMVISGIAVGILGFTVLLVVLICSSLVTSKICDNLYHKLLQSGKNESFSNTMAAIALTFLSSMMAVILLLIGDWSLREVLTISDSEGINSAIYIIGKSIIAMGMIIYVAIDIYLFLTRRVSPPAKSEKPGLSQEGL